MTPFKLWWTLTLWDHLHCWRGGTCSDTSLLLSIYFIFITANWWWIYEKQRWYELWSVYCKLAILTVESLAVTLIFTKLPQREWALLPDLWIQMTSLILKVCFTWFLQFVALRALKTSKVTLNVQSERVAWFPDPTGSIPQRTNHPYTPVYITYTVN